MSKVFKSIALCFSGGGYRASCFSLGALSLFEKIGLLDKVEAISTVSGGTITGVKYAQSQVENQSFDEFFEDYYKWLYTDELVNNALSHIKGNKIWKEDNNKHKRQNPINSFAIEYNKFTSQRTLGDIQEAISNNKTHLKRVVFNATDFSSGLQFRFQNIKGNGLRFGNQEGHKYKDLIGQIKLGDILASSSAFPGGFEPISFPHDFVPDYDKNEKGLGLMDGGIVDNQGASVFKKKDEDSDDAHDLIFICDVASLNMESFEFTKKNFVTRFIKYLASFPMLLIFLFLSTFFFKSSWWFLYTTTIVITSLMILLQILLHVASNAVKNATGIERNLVLPPDRFGIYLLDRANSLLKMTMDVFLKNDRRQNDKAFFKDFKDKAIKASIYELRCDKDGKPENELKWGDIKLHTGEISNKIKNITKEASAFGTTLWFGKQDKENNTLDKVIACGEITTCYNLLAHLIRFYPDDIKKPKTEIGLLFIELKKLWTELSENPQLIVKSRKANIQL